LKPLEVEETLKSIISKGVKCPVVVKGDAGIGKSQVIQKVGRELGMEVIDLRLAQMEPGDLIGLPRTDPETHKTVWYAPEWWPAESANGTIIFFDELNRAPVDVRQAVFQVLTEYKMHTHVLPPKCFLVAAINPDDGGKMNYQVEQFDPAMINRMCFITMEPDVQQWINWATPQGLHEMVIKFIAVNGAMLYSGSETGPFPSPRSWHKLSDLMNAGAIPPASQSEVITGLIGDKPAIAFIRFLDKSYKKPVSGKEVLESFPKFKEKVKVQRNDENFVTISELVGLLGDGAKLKKDQLVNVTDFALSLKQEEKMALLKKLPNSLLSKLGTSSQDLCNTIAGIAAEMDKERGR
jgi:hypothetical protein